MLLGKIQAGNIGCRSSSLRSLTVHNSPNTSDFEKFVNQTRNVIDWVMKHNSELIIQDLKPLKEKVKADEALPAIIPVSSDANSDWAGSKIEPEPASQ